MEVNQRCVRWHPPPHGSQCRVHGLHVGLHKRCRPQKHLGPAKDPPHVPLPPEQRADRARDDVVGQGLVVDPQRTQHGVCIVGNGACEVLQGRIAWRPWVAVPHRHCLHCTLCIIAHINDGQLQVAQLPLVCGFVIRLDVQRVDVMLSCATARLMRGSWTRHCGMAMAWCDAARKRPTMASLVRPRTARRARWRHPWGSWMSCSCSLLLCWAK